MLIKDSSRVEVNMGRTPQPKKMNSNHITQQSTSQLAAMSPSKSAYDGSFSLVE